MKANKLRIYRGWCLFGIVVLLLSGCSQGVDLAEAFTLWEGETVNVRQTGLSITAQQVSIGQPGSQRTDIGLVTLQVRLRGEEQAAFTLEVGETAEAGGYVILIDGVVSQIERDGCVIVVEE